MEFLRYRRLICTCGACLAIGGAGFAETRDVQAAAVSAGGAIIEISPEVSPAGTAVAYPVKYVFAPALPESPVEPAAIERQHFLK